MNQSPAVEQGQHLWSPSKCFAEESNINQFILWLQQQKSMRSCHKVRDYETLWQWSVDHIDDFWLAVWHYFDVQSPTPFDKVLTTRTMPEARWFSGSSVNFAEHILRNERDDAIALYAYSELHAPQTIDWHTLADQVRIVATQLRKLGVKPGDRVAAYLPNSPEAVIAFLASASIGAIFSSCSPDFGVKSVIDRFSQTHPTVLFCADGYRFGGKNFDRRKEARAIVQSLSSVNTVIQLPYLFKTDEVFIADAILWKNIIKQPAVSAESFQFEQLPFDHPLWIVYSSGTTGLPKPIVHSHGGITLEFLKLLGFHMNLKPDSTMFFYSSTGWIMWNIVVGSLITGGAAVLYDGNPAADNGNILWQLASDSGATFFGASPTYVSMMEKLRITPNTSFDLSNLEGILLGGSPVTPESMSWCYQNIKQDLWVTSQSGGTDIASAFVGASPTLPVYAGEIQARCLGVDAHAFDDNGNSLTNNVGELVICQPMPSMPIYFWNDENNARYRASYFEDYPNVWKHGDYFQLNERGGCFIFGRSDSTLNRYGVRIGTAEIYRTVEKIEEISDSIIVNLTLDDGKFFMPLFVSFNNGITLDDRLRDKIRLALKTEYSPRHVPDKIIQIDAVPYTLTNKKMEVPVRKILSGMQVDKAANPDAMANPEALVFFANYAKDNQDYLMHRSAN
ncbi:acetoacetate--CoA ligase [Gammaproteobacteria bacterium 45_16_T64]|nr:acetoacetate--CoA ligase [Gammaproteobacteria bacterium 45_16_T64]